MNLLLAFLLGGALCALAQAACVVLKFDKPLPCLILFFCIGGLLGPTGLVSMLEEVCQAGIIATVIDPGTGIQVGVSSAMAGVPLPLVIMLLAIVCMIVIGIVTGLVASSCMGGKHD